MRISSRGNVSTGPVGALVLLLLGVMVLLAVVAWPVAVANSSGHFAWWGWPAEIGWLAVLITGSALAASRRR
ncbi:MAG: hypothetical protein M3Y33_09185 [Actinomycetota bacterium]|nr:hypothetical protein [Actinomycetota bacterium]